MNRYLVTLTVEVDADDDDDAFDRLQDLFERPAEFDYSMHAEPLDDSTLLH